MTTRGVGARVNAIRSTGFLAAALVASSAAAQEAAPAIADPAPSILTSQWLTGDWNGARKKAQDDGVDLNLELTQFGSGMTSGFGSHDWQYGGKVDLYATIDGAKSGLMWEGFSVSAHAEQNYDRSVNGFGGTLIPTNTALAFPGEELSDLSLSVRQKFSDVFSIRFGKLNIVDFAKATPLKGGGGIDTFMNTALAAPITGLLPPKVFGAFFNLDTKPLSFALAVYDPVDATRRTGLYEPFREGVSFRFTATYAAAPFGLPGFYGVRALYSTTSGLDWRTVGELLFPSTTSTALAKRSGPHFFGLSMQQYLVTDADDPKRGWGVFGEIGVSDGNPTPQDWAGLFGFGGTSLVPERPMDRWGVAIFRNSISDEITRVLRPAARGGEQGLEAFYNVAVTPWLHVSADVQFIRPFFRQTYPDATVATVRTNIKF
jgi:porin